MSLSSDSPYFIQGSANGFGGIACIYLLANDLNLLKEWIPRCFSEAPISLTISKIHLSYFGAKSDPIDQVLWCVLTPEESFFRAFTLEINFHGGPQIMQRAKAYLLEQGIEETNAERWMTHTLGKIEAQAYTYALESISSVACNAFLLQYQGALRLRLQKILTSLESSDIPETLALIENLLQTAPFGMALRIPTPFILYGKTNVGKSSLFNRLLGEERAIVSPQQGTTIDLIQVKRLLKGYPILLVDSAGWTETPSQLERLGQEKLQMKLKGSVPIWVWEATSFSEEEEIPMGATPSIWVINKVDQVSQVFPEKYLSISAQTGAGISILEEKMAEFLPKPCLAEDGILFEENQVHFLRQAKENLLYQRLEEGHANLLQLLS